MKRIAAWLLSTVTVAVLMFGYHTSTDSTLATLEQPAISAGRTPGSTSGSTSGSASATSSSGSSTVTGEVARTQWGPVQVQLTVTGQQVTGVSVVQYPSGSS